MDMRSYFEQAMLMQPGDRLLIPAAGAKEAESRRVQLMAMRRRFARINASIYYDIGVTKAEMDGKWFTILEKRKKIDDAFILRGNGSIEQIISPNVESNELKRLISMMLNDGLNPSDVHDNLSDRFSAEDIERVIAEVNMEKEGAHDQNSE